MVQMLSYFLINTNILLNLGFEPETIISAFVFLDYDDIHLGRANVRWKSAWGPELPNLPLAEGTYLEHLLGSRVSSYCIILIL